MKAGKSPQGEINIIPLVDIVLVILIIFMIAAPLMTSGIGVSLPKVQKSPLVERAVKPLTVVITKEGVVKVKGKAVDIGTLRFWLEEMYKTGKVRDVEIAADKRCDYGTVAKVLAAIKEAGISKVALLTENLPSNEKK